jgi:hypothetical protein
MTAGGAPLRHLATTVVPADETLLVVVESAEVELVRTLFERAGLGAPRISGAIHDDGLSRPPRP